MSGDFELPAEDRTLEIYPLYLRALGLYVRHWPLVTAIYLPVALVSSLCLFLGAPTLADANPEPGKPFVIPPNEWLAFAGTLLIVFSFGLWSVAAIYRVADAATAGGPVPGFRGAYSQAIERVPALLGAQLLYVLMVMLGMVFCVLPGIWLGVMLLPALPRVATREIGPVAALEDARALVAGRWWRVAVFSIFVVLTIYAIYAPYFFLNMLLPHGQTWALLVRAAANIFVALLVAPFQAFAHAVLHHRLEETA